MKIKARTGWGLLILTVSIISLTAANGHAFGSSGPKISISQPAHEDIVSKTVIIQGTASAGSGDAIKSIKISLGETGICTSVSRTWSCSWDSTMAPDGWQYLQAQVLTYGNRGATAQRKVYVANHTSVPAKPKSAITAPENLAVVSGKVDITAHISIGAGDSVDRVEFKRGYHLICSVSRVLLSQTYNCPWDTTANPDRMESLTAVVFTTFGWVASSSPLGVFVENSPPQAAILTPADGAILSGGVAVSFSASESGAIEKVDLFLDGRLVKTYPGGHYIHKVADSYSWDTTRSRNGPHKLKIIATDIGGNASSAEVHVRVKNTGRPPRSKP